MCEKQAEPPWLLDAKIWVHQMAFLTYDFQCKLPEVLAALGARCNTADHPDLWHRVFQLKKQELLDLITRRASWVILWPMSYNHRVQKACLPLTAPPDMVQRGATN